MVSSLKSDQLDADYVSSKATVATVLEKMEVLVEDGKIQGGERVDQEVLLRQSLIQRVDDWFVLLDVVPRVVPYMQPGTDFFLCCFAKCGLFVLLEYSSI